MHSPILAAVPPVRHGFFGRDGGLSTGAFATLNVSLRVGDAPEAVAQNRARIAQRLGLVASAWRQVHQVHGDEVVQVRADSDPLALESCRADALITTCPDVVLAVVTADCVPLLLCDAHGHAVAAVHAGWRGIAANIIVKVARQICALVNCSPQQLRVALGPAIGPCCFEVGEETIDALAVSLGARSVAQASVRSGKRGRPHVDLWALGQAQLQQFGVLPQHIWCSKRCTSCLRDSYFSYRAHRGVCGRQAAVVARAKAALSSEAL